MKKLSVLIFFFAFLNLQLRAQICKTAQDSLSSADATAQELENYCGAYASYYPTGSQKTIIYVNYIALQPLSGVGKWDTVTQASCIAQINIINKLWDSLLPPTKVIPNPPIFFR